MFVGHLAVALGAKQIEPRLPLAALTMAAFGLDVLWPIFLLGGLEAVRIHPGDTAFTPLDFVSYPWSHSLLTSLCWGALGGAVAAAALKSARAGAVTGVLIVSHWVLDFVTHRPDLPLWPGGPLQGLGLWNSVGATIAVEGAMLATGLAIYTRATRAAGAPGRWAFWGLIALVSVMWISGPFSPPPPNEMAIAIVGLAFAVLMVPWTMWIEKYRPVSARRSGMRMS